MCCVENMIDCTQNERLRTLELRSKLSGPRGACRSGLEAATADVAKTPRENRASVSRLGPCCAEPRQGGPFLPSFPPVSYERGRQTLAVAWSNVLPYLKVCREKLCS